MQLGFKRREVWSLLYPSSLPPIQATSCMMSTSNQLLKPKNYSSWPSHKEKNPTQCSAKFITRPLLPIEYLGQKRLEIYPPPSPNEGQENIAQLHLRVLGGEGALGGGWLAVPFYSVQDCSQEYCGMGRERKNLYRSMSIVSKTG